MEFEAEMWHGTTRRGNLARWQRNGIRDTLYLTSDRQEAVDYAGLELDIDEPGELIPITVQLRTAHTYQESRPRDAEQRARAEGADGIIIHHEADMRDPSSPMPARTWVIALTGSAVRIGHRHDIQIAILARLPGEDVDTGLVARALIAVLSPPVKGVRPIDAEASVALGEPGDDTNTIWLHATVSCALDTAAARSIQEELRDALERELDGVTILDLTVDE